MEELTPQFLPSMKRCPRLYSQIWALRRIRIRWTNLSGAPLRTSHDKFSQYSLRVYFLVELHLLFMLRRTTFDYAPPFLFTADLNLVPLKVFSIAPRNEPRLYYAIYIESIETRVVHLLTIRWFRFYLVSGLKFSKLYEGPLVLLLKQFVRTRCVLENLHTTTPFASCT